MNDEHYGRSSALAELRKRLTGGMARARLNQTELALLAQLGRTTVSEALSPNKPVPSEATVARLAGALKLPVEELRALQRTAAGESGMSPTGGPGRPISEWEPHDLEVHPASPGRNTSSSATSVGQVLPGYVAREHDQRLAEAVRDVMAGRSRIVVLVGTSSTGKTRACWEAVQPLADQGWRLWHPFDPTRAQAALEELHRVGPRTVVWLNEAQHYFGDRARGDEIAAAVHHLLVTPERGPVLVLGTLWPDYERRYKNLPAAGAADPHSRVREVLSGRTLTVPDAFDSQALAAATALAEGGDQLLQEALTRARTHGRVTQDLAGAPELLNRYQHASPAAKALLEAAMDARRLGVGLHLPQAFLTDAALDYLTDNDYDQLTDDWAEHAFAYLARLVHGKQAPLRRVRPRPARRSPGSPTSSQSTMPAPGAGPMFHLAAYLEEHGRSTRRALCPPVSFWYAAMDHLAASDDRVALGEAARLRWRLNTAAQLFQDPAEAGHPDALLGLAHIHDILGNDQHAETMYERTADAGSTTGMNDWYWKHKRVGDEKIARKIDRRAADAGDLAALLRTEVQSVTAGQRAADRQKWKDEQIDEATAAGYTSVVDYLTALTEESWTEAGAARLKQKVNDLGFEDPHGYLSAMWSLSGDTETALRTYEAGAAAAHPEALYRLAIRNSEAGDMAAAVDLALQAVHAGHPEAAALLAWELEASGDLVAAEHWHRHAAERGKKDHLLALIRLRRQAHDPVGALTVCQEAANTARVDLLHSLNREELSWRDLCAYGLEPDGTPSDRWQPPSLG